MDKVLTHPVPHLPLRRLLEKYSRRPPNLAEVNRFSCEVLFCSTLLDRLERVDSTLFYELLECETARSAALRWFVKRCKEITPPGFTWHYGRAWDRLAQAHRLPFAAVESREDFVGSPYYGRAKIFISWR